MLLVAIFVLLFLIQVIFLARENRNKINITETLQTQTSCQSLSRPSGRPVFIPTSTDPLSSHIVFKTKILIVLLLAFLA